MTDAQREQEATELLRTLIRNACVNDGSAASGHEVRNADTLEAYFVGSGLSCARYTAAPGRTSLLTRIEGRDPTASTLPLMGHTDVVPADGAGWRHDPFEATLEDSVVWGRGATDMLNLTATMAVAVRELARSAFRPRGTLLYLAAADEEAGGTYGVGYLMAHAPDEMNADYVITESGGVPIPTAAGPLLPLTVAEKGTHWRRVVVRGTAGHGSLPFGADNAVVTAALVIQRIAEYRPMASILDVWRQSVEALGLGPEATALLTDPNQVLAAAAGFDPALARVVHACTHTTFSPNLVSGGLNMNVIPDRVTIDVDIRSLPGATPADVDRMLREAIGDLTGRVEIEAVSSEAASVSPWPSPLADALTRVAAALAPGSRIVPQLAPGASDARFFRRQGIPSYGFGLHSSRIPHTEYPGMFHGVNERIDTDSLRLSCVLWETLCREFLA